MRNKVTISHHIVTKLIKAPKNPVLCTNKWHLHLEAIRPNSVVFVLVLLTIFSTFAATRIYTLRIPLTIYCIRISLPDYRLLSNIYRFFEEASLFLWYSDVANVQCFRVCLFFQWDEIVHWLRTPKKLQKPNWAEQSKLIQDKNAKWASINVMIFFALHIRKYWMFGVSWMFCSKMMYVWLFNIVYLSFRYFLLRLISSLSFSRYLFVCSDHIFHWTLWMQHSR